MNKKMKEMDKMLDKTLGVILEEGETDLVLFKGNKIRKKFYNDEWYYSVTDIVAAITESEKSSDYWQYLKSQLIEEEGFSELPEKIRQLEMKVEDGELREMDTADVETIFRIIQSIPSKKAEIFKRWLAKVGYERIQEIQNPEIGIKRSIAQYKAQGRSDEWVNNRVKGTLTRNELTDEWAKRGVEGTEYAHLTDVISKGAFDVTTAEHREHKGLKKKGHGLRDNMSTLELAVMNVGEATTAEITRQQDARGFNENLESAKAGGDVAGKSRIAIEAKIGKKVLTSQNFIQEAKSGKLSDKK